MALPIAAWLGASRNRTIAALERNRINGESEIWAADSKNCRDPKNSIITVRLDPSNPTIINNLQLLNASYRFIERAP